MGLVLITTSGGNIHSLVSHRLAIGHGLFTGDRLRAEAKLVFGGDCLEVGIASRRHFTVGAARRQ